MKKLLFPLLAVLLVCLSTTALPAIDSQVKISKNIKGKNGEYTHGRPQRKNHVENKFKAEPDNGFITNSEISSKERKSLRPYLLPADHPLKEILDSIFYTSRATLNEATFAAAGFTTKFSQPRSFIKVASHPLIPGFLVKIYLDSELRIKNKVKGWKWFERRIEGANKIRKYIKKAHVKHFVVAQKWIYPLPMNPSPPNDPAYERKNTILVVEDMNLVPEEENYLAWKTKITEKHLKELYCIITYAGGDSYRPDNIVYTKNGKFAFIDTEYPYKQPNYRLILHHLSPEMAEIWTKLVSGKMKPN